MKYIIVEQFKHDDYLNIGVVDDNTNDFIEVQHGLELPDVYKLITNYKNSYKVNTIVFVLYGDSNEEIYRREIIEQL